MTSLSQPLSTDSFWTTPYPSVSHRLFNVYSWPDSFFKSIVKWQLPEVRLAGICWTLLPFLKSSCFHSKAWCQEKLEGLLWPHQCQNHLNNEVYIWKKKKINDLDQTGRLTWLRDKTRQTNTGETMRLSVKFRSNRLDHIVLSVHHMLHKVHRVFLTWCTAPPRYLFALSHWASHPAVSAFVLSWKQQCDRSWVGVRDEQWGNGQVFTVEGGGWRDVMGWVTKARQKWLMESWEGFDMEEEEREYLLSLCFQACCYCVVKLTSNQPSHLSVLRVGPVLLTTGLYSNILDKLYVCKQMHC